MHGVMMLLPADELKANMESKDFWEQFHRFRTQIHSRGTLLNYIPFLIINVRRSFT